jgi:hypothetical protein
MVLEHISVVYSTATGKKRSDIIHLSEVAKQNTAHLRKKKTRNTSSHPRVIPQTGSGMSLRCGKKYLIFLDAAV